MVNDGLKPFYTSSMASRQAYALGFEILVDSHCFRAMIVVFEVRKAKVDLVRHALLSR